MMSTQDIYSESFMTDDTKASDTTEKSTGEALKERLFYDPKNTYTAMSQETLHAANDFAVTIWPFSTQERRSVRWSNVRWKWQKKRDFNLTHSA